MKVFLVPSVVSGLNAALSVLFFAGLSFSLGDDILGHIIFVQSIAAVVTAVCVPQSWVFLISAQNHAELIERYRCGLTVEAGGIFVGSLAITLVLFVPFLALEGWRIATALIYFSLSIQAMGSCIGWLRANEDWSRYALWVIGPNLIRIPLVWATPFFVARGLLPDPPQHPYFIVALFFLLPDLVRLIGIALPLAVRHYRWPGAASTRASARIIFRNWLYELGSMATNVIDKIVVGAFLGPQPLVTYFFGRKMGIVATMITEPFYAEHFRRLATLERHRATRAKQHLIYTAGIGLAVILFFAVMLCIIVMINLPSLPRFLPTAVIGSLPLFAAVLLIECLISANRWIRFVAQLNGGNFQLLGVRLIVAAIFALSVWVLGRQFGSVGLATAFFLSWLLEAIYLLAQIKHAGSGQLNSERDVSPTPFKFPTEVQSRDSVNRPLSLLTVAQRLMQSYKN